METGVIVRQLCLHWQMQNRVFPARNCDCVRNKCPAMNEGNFWEYGWLCRDRHCSAGYYRAMWPNTARSRDADDPLHGFRSGFIFADDAIYLDGNSLGRLPKRTADVIRTLVDDEWGRGLVRSWGSHWIDLPRRLGDKIGQLIGARKGEVLACDSTSVNFFKLAMAALEIRPERQRVITDAANFPSDLYLLQGCARLRELEIVCVPGDDPEAVLTAIDPDTALVTLSHVAFKSGLRHDIAAITAAAHQAGALVLWDLSHSVGAVPMQLHNDEVDLAVGCTYKYLNGGPGAPAFLYVRDELQESLQNPIQGWFGQKRAFEFGPDYEPADGIARFMTGTPPILSMAAVEPGVDLLLKAGMDRLWAKSQAQTAFLSDMACERLVPLGFRVIEPSSRGSHVSLSHPEAWRINQALIEEMHVIPDFRAPEVIRLGVAPIYTTYTELVEAVERIDAVVTERRYERYSKERSGVT